MFLPLATSGCILPLENFWNSLLLYHSRPNVINKRIVGVKNLYFYKVNFTSNSIKSLNELFSYSAILYEIRKVKALGKDDYSNIIFNLLKPYDKSVTLTEANLNEFKKSQDCIFVSVKLLLAKLNNYENCVEIVIFDKRENIATFIAVNENNKHVLAPPFQYHIELMSSHHMRIIVDNFEDAESNSAEWLCDKLFLKLVKWAENYDSNAITQPSISLISIDRYSRLYRELKTKYGKKMVKIWPESTDPLKFVYEDIAIATYLICLWNQLTPNYKPSFVDLGCGNGLLVYILNEEGFNGEGIDVRKRKIWDMYPPTVKLEVKTIVPSSNCLFPDVDWIIGNHSDELTPWIPVISARSNYKTNFFLLPCCFYDFDGKKYSRMQTSNSQYCDYLEYIQTICNVCGFMTKQDKLRIPSTKKTCIVSTGRTYTGFIEIDNQITEFINKRCNLHCADSSKDNWSKNFVPRSDAEKVRNCTQLSRELIERIIQNVVNRLLKEENYIDKKDGSNKWNTGGELTFQILVQSISKSDLKQLKKECGGLQTLFRNHRYIFDLSNEKIKLRLPPEFKFVQKYKSKPCWFYRNHPDGCLHESCICAYNH